MQTFHIPSIREQEQKLILLNTGEVFGTAVNANEKYNSRMSDISKCCKNQRNYAGIHALTEEYLQWQYYDSI